MTSGGEKRMVWPWVSLARRPRRRRSSTTGRAGPDVGVQLDRQHQAAAADLLDPVGADGFEAGLEVGAELGRPLDQPLLDQHLQRGAGDGAGERVAAEGRAVLAGLQDAEDVGVGEDGRDRVEAAAQRLADQRDVGLDALVLLGEELAGAAEAGLDLVEDQGDAVAGADVADARGSSRPAG